MGRVMAPAGQMERSTPLLCRQCASEFEAVNRNGKQKIFCSRRCKDRWGNAQRLKGAALLKTRHPSPVTRHRWPSNHAQAISQCVFLALGPIEERAELLRLAAENIGITNQDAIDAAMRRAQVPSYEGSV